MIVFRSHLFIPVDMFTRDMERALRIPNPMYGKEGYREEEPEFVLYKLVEARGKPWYRVPRYALGAISKLLTRTDIDMSVPDVPISIQWKPKKKITLNDSQVDTVAQAYDMLTREWGSVIVAKTGEGKTTMAIKLITQFRQKTLILVHKDILARQWRDELLALTNLTKQRIGSLQQGRFYDGDVVIGSQASLMRTTIGAKINAEFGLVIQDETHRIGAKMFLRSFTRFNARYRLGLSATPHREDSTERLYFAHMSDNLIEHKSVRNVAADYTQLRYTRKVPWVRYGGWMPYKVGLVNNIITDDVRNAWLLALLKLMEGRSVLILSERVAHLQYLMKKSIKLFPKRRCVKFFGPDMPTSKTLDKADLLFATYQKAKEGTNIPHLDTLVFATPVASRITVVQAKGRIERTLKGKKQPLVIDIVDTGVPLLEGMGEKRARIYLEFSMLEVDPFQH